MMSARGIKSKVGGTRYVTKMDVPGKPALGKLRRARAWPARSPQASEMTVDTTAMKNVFHSQRGKAVLARRSWTWAKVGCKVQKGALLTARQERYSSSSGRMAVMSIQ
jgi:hypothetical protein